MLPMDVCLYFVDCLDRGGFQPLENDIDFPYIVEHEYNGEQRVEKALNLSAGLKLRMLGSGHFAYVCEDPYDNERVVKVSMRGHDASLDFYKFVLENPHPIFPTIHALVVTRRYYVVSMERLDSLDPYNGPRTEAIMQHIRRIIGGDGCIAYNPVTKYADMAGLDLLQKFRNDVMNNRSGIGDLDGYRNFMSRKGQLVVTDPIYISPSGLDVVNGLRTIGHPIVRYTYEKLDGIRHANDPRQINASTVLPPIEPHRNSQERHAMRAVEVLQMREKGIRGHSAIFGRGRETNPLKAVPIHKCFRITTATRRMLEHGMLNPGPWMAGAIWVGAGGTGRERHPVVRELEASHPNGVEIGLHGRMARTILKQEPQTKVPERVRGCKHCGMVLGGVAHRNAIKQFRLAGLRGDRRHCKRIVRGEGCQFCCSPGNRNDRRESSRSVEIRPRSKDSHLDRQRPCRPDWFKDLTSQITDVGEPAFNLADSKGPEVLRFSALQDFDFCKP